MRRELQPVDWAARTTRFVLFTGKGGVGKTTVAAAMAVALADRGLSVLLVSTDPASNLSDVFEVAAGEHPTRVGAVPGLDVMDLDPQVAADEYRERVIGPHRGKVPEVELEALEERLAGACTVEVAAFDTFVRLLVDRALIGDYDHVIFDTAPTGHTLRLLSLPAAWGEYLSANPDATSCLGPLGGAEDHRPTYAAAVAVLCDASRTTVVLVSRPDLRAFAVAADAAAELVALGIDHQMLVVNGVLVRPLAGDRVAEAYAAEQQTAIEQLPAALERLPVSMVPLVAPDLIGVPALRRLTKGDVSGAAQEAAPVRSAPPKSESIDALVDQLEAPRHGVVLIAGKGGVGKTTVARLLAVALANRRHKVHLATTDPAATAPTTEGDLAGLSTSAIDPQVVTDEYVAARLATAAERGTDRACLDLLAEDLRSPCTQELAVFQAFSQLLRRGRDEFVVIDTAPTGHTMLLLDVTGAFHRQVMKSPGLPHGRVHTPLMWLQDPGYSRLLIVTLAETTPVNEAAELQDDLRRAGIEPYGWIVNATLTHSGTADPVLRSRASLEGRQIERVRSLSSHVWTLPWSSGL